jgi:hypothetical protein
MACRSFCAWTYGFYSAMDGVISFFLHTIIQMYVLYPVPVVLVSSFTYPYLKLLISLQERCAAAETVSLVARVLNRSRAHLHSVLSQNSTSVVEEFFGTLVNFTVAAVFGTTSILLFSSI